MSAAEIDKVLINLIPGAGLVRLVESKVRVKLYRTAEGAPAMIRVERKSNGGEDDGLVLQAFAAAADQLREYRRNDAVKSVARRPNLSSEVRVWECLNEILNALAKAGRWDHSLGFEAAPEIVRKLIADLNLARGDCDVIREMYQNAVEPENRYATILEAVIDELEREGLKVDASSDLPRLIRGLLKKNALLRQRCFQSDLVRNMRVADPYRELAEQLRESAFRTLEPGKAERAVGRSPALAAPYGQPDAKLEAYLEALLLGLFVVPGGV